MMRRVVINGQSYAVGLDWFPLKEDMKRAELVLEAEGYDEKCDLSVVLEKQYALARSRNRSWKRVRSLAATLVLNKYPDAVHVFPLVDADDDTPFWWVIGVRRGIVSGQTDRCFDTREDAESVAVSVQDSLGVPELQSFSDADVLLNHTKPTKTSFMNDPAALGHLKDTAAIKLLKASAIAVGFAFGWWAVDSVLEYRAAQEALEQARILTQNKEKRAKELAEHPERYFSSKWMQAPLPETFFNQCAPEMFRFPMAANGWGLSSLSCSGSSLSATWQQTPLSDYTHLPFNALLDPQKPKIATSSRPLPPLAGANRSASSLLSQRDAARRLYALTQHFRLNLKKLTFAKRQTKTVERISLSCPWVKASFELDHVPAFLVADYVSLGKALSEIPGLIVTEISYSDNWTIRGELYAH